jgi:hypothetical protein
MLCKVIRLNTGEIIIGNITEESRSYIDVYRPVRIVMKPVNDAATVSVTFIRWELISDFNNPVRIFKHALVSVSDPTEEFSSNYIEVFENFEDYINFIKKDSYKNNKHGNELTSDFNSIEDAFKQLIGSNTKVTFH